MVIVIAISALFFAQNDATVEIKYFAGTSSWPLHWVLLVALLAGMVIGFSSLFTSLLTTKVKLANVKRKLALQQKEISNLRSLPIKDEY